MKKILFIGNFLSKSKYTVGPTERVIDFLKDTYSIKSASEYQNRFIRLGDMVLKTLISKYDYIHVDVYSTSNSQFYQNLVTYIAKLRNKNIILNLHGGGLWDLYTEDPSSITTLFSRAHIIISPSKFLQNMFTDVGFNIDYLPNNIDLSNFPPKNNSQNGYNLLWIRAFHEVYQPWLAIRALFHVKETFKDAKLTMIGPDKGYLAEMMELINELGLNDSIEILGKVPNDELYSFHHSHQVFLNTTRYESFGVAVLEAAACGIPVVSTKVGEIPYLWSDNENILLIEDDDPEEMANSIIKLFNNPEFSQDIALKALEKAKLFDVNLIKLRWMELFN